jgi:hypothetical protein
MADALRRALARETERLIARRELMMATLEIKGLADSLAAAKQSMAQVRIAGTAIQASAAALVTSLTQIKTAIDAAHADMKVEMQAIEDAAIAEMEAAQVRPQPTAVVSTAPPNDTLTNPTLPQWAAPGKHEGKTT